MELKLLIITTTKENSFVLLCCSKYKEYLAHMSQKDFQYLWWILRVIVQNVAYKPF